MSGLILPGEAGGGGAPSSPRLVVPPGPAEVPGGTSIPSIRCEACGYPLPIPEKGSEERRLLDLSGRVPRHAVCPTAVAAPQRRWYEALVIVIEHDDEDPGDRWSVSPSSLAAAGAARTVVEALSFAGAVEPLAEKLGEAWNRVAEKAAFADRPPEADGE